MAKSPSEQIRDLALELRGMTEREAALRDHLSDLKKRDAKHEDEIAELRKENAELRRELTETKLETTNAITALKQQLQDHVKHTELSDARRWTFVLAFVSALLALASGLIISLARK